MTILSISNVSVFAPLNTSRFAGDTVRILELVKGLRTLGVSVNPIIPTGLSEDVSDKFAPYTSFNLPQPSNLMLRFAALSFFCQYLPPRSVYESDYEILQIEGSFAFPLSKTRDLAKKSNVIFDMHSIVAIDLDPYLPSFLRLPIGSVIHAAQDYLCRTSHVLVVSNCMKNYITHRLGINSNNVHVIENGVNLDLARNMIKERANTYEWLRENSDPLLVYVGGLEWYEGVDVLINALAQAKKEFPRITLALAGRGSDEEKLKRLTQSLGLDQNVRFLGWIPYEDTFALQSVADILVAPRKPLRTSGIDINTPMKLPSYLSAKKPIIASGVGEIPFVARHMKEAYLVNHSDVSEIVEAITNISNDHNLANKLGQNAAIRAERYDWKNISKRLLEVYNLVLS